MTEAELAQIEARAKAATPGPWTNGGQGWVFGQGKTGYGDPEFEDLVAQTHNERDASFISRTREDVPNLIAEVKRLRATLDQVRVKVKSQREHGHIAILLDDLLFIVNEDGA